MPTPTDNAGEREKGPAKGAEAPDPLVGRRVRDFQIVECIGRGGMGAVYRAEHVLLGEPRALKVVRAEALLATPDAAVRFQREARIGVKLRHPNLVVIHDFFVEDASHFLVMEYVEGVSLAKRLRREGALSIDDACRIAIECCAGLAHAHEQGVIHRDLSPGNVMLEPGPEGARAKIIDFGIARLAAAASDETPAQADMTLTRIGDFLGKPRYASPEQAGLLRRGERIDQRSDLYSMGVILYEMLTGAMPFESESTYGYLSAHLTEQPTPPRRRRPDLRIPAQLERVVLCCLEKDRTKRFQDARAMAAAIEWAWHDRDRATTPPELRGRRREAGEPRAASDTADAPGWSDAGERLAWLRPLLLLLAGAAALGLVALVASSLLDSWRQGAVSPSAPAPAAAPAPAQEAVVPGEPDAPVGPPARDEPEVAPREAVTPEPTPAAVAPPEPAPPPAPVEVAAPDPAPPASVEVAAPEPAPAPVEITAPAPSPSPAPVAIAAPDPTPTPAAPTPEPARPATETPRATPAPAAAGSRSARAEPPRAAARPAPRAPERVPAPERAPAPAQAAPFASESEAQAAFDAALAYERSHPARDAVRHWKAYRARSPSRALDEQARRRITELTMAQMRELR
jgi:serine/threonine protein kinase